MRLQQYLAESEKQYHLRLKTIVPLDDAAMDRIEMSVAKYLPLSIAPAKKTILQRQPLEFPDIQNAEVYIVDMVFGMPAAPHVIRDDVRKALNVPDNQIFVRNQHEPNELEMAQLNAIAEIETEAAIKGLQPVATLQDQDYNEADSAFHADQFGNAYNAAFLSYLRTVQQERQTQADKAAAAPFLWLDIPDRPAAEIAPDFNAAIPDAPRVAPTGITTPDVNKSPLGYSATSNEIRRVYVDANGKRVVLSRKLDGDGV